MHIAIGRVLLTELDVVTLNSSNKYYFTVVRVLSHMSFQIVIYKSLIKKSRFLEVNCLCQDHMNTTQHLGNILPKNGQIACAQRAYWKYQVPEAQSLTELSFSILYLSWPLIPVFFGLSKQNFHDNLDLCSEGPLLHPLLLLPTQPQWALSFEPFVSARALVARRWKNWVLIQITNTKSGVLADLS